jgi:hypothetical protein
MCLLTTKYCVVVCSVRCYYTRSFFCNCYLLLSAAAVLQAHVVVWQSGLHYCHRLSESESIALSDNILTWYNGHLT